MSHAILHPLRASVVLATLALALLVAPPARAVDIQRVVSPGGIEAWLVRDTLAPVVSVAFAFRHGGAVDDPQGKEGLATMVAGLLDEGAGPLDSQAFQGRLEDLSVGLSFSAGRDHFSGSLRTLSANRAEAFDMLRLALNEPRFDAEPVGRVRAQLIAARKRAVERPQTIASETWFKTAFPNHPYGRPADGTEESIAAISTADLNAFTRDWLSRDALKIAVVGDITADDLAARLDHAFGGLPESGARSTVGPAAMVGAGVTRVIEKAIPQSVAVFGQPGIKRGDPDYYALVVLNNVLGGSGFSSRLTEEVREKRGLAYSVYSYPATYDHAGLIMGGVATRNADVAESLRLIREEWRRMETEGVDAARLASAKNNINGSFPLQLTSTGQIASLLLGVQLDDLGIDYLDRRSGLINAVTVADVQRVARRLLDPAKLTVVVVGQPAGLEGSN